MFLYSKSSALSSQVRVLSDVIVLSDGTQIHGEVISIPGIPAFFEAGHLPLDEVAAISTMPGTGDSINMKVLTHSGNVYMGCPGSQTLTFKSNEKRCGEWHIPMDDILIIMMKNRGSDHGDEYEKKSSVLPSQEFLPFCLEEIFQKVHEFDSKKQRCLLEGISYPSAQIRYEKPLLEEEGYLASPEEPQDASCHVDLFTYDALKSSEEKPHIKERNHIQSMPECQNELDLKAVESNSILLSPACVSQEGKFSPREYLDGYRYIPGEHPDGSGFYIRLDKITNEEYKKFVDAINYRAPHHWVGNQIPEGMEKDPVVNVTYRDAFLYAVWIGKRLPAVDELESLAGVETEVFEKSMCSCEWTSTPSPQIVLCADSTKAAKLEDSYIPAHQVYHPSGIFSMNNHDWNKYTGFRTAMNAY